MKRRTVLKGMAATAAGSFLARPAIAADTTLKIGCSLPLTGAGFTAVGRELTGALKVYMAQHGDTVAGRKIELIIRDDAGVADNCAPPGPGNDRQRQSRYRRRRHHALYARHCCACDRGQEGDRSA